MSQRREGHRQYSPDEVWPRSESEVPDRGIDPAEPVVTAQRDGLALFCFRESLIAWLTWSVGQRTMTAKSLFIGFGGAAVLVALCFLTVIVKGYLIGRNAAFPYTYDPRKRVSAEEILEIQRLIRSRGENYLISVNVVTATKAEATTGDGSYRAKKGRFYTIAKDEAAWRIQDVENWKN